MQKSTLKIGELLLYAGKISSEQLNTALESQNGTNRKLGEVLVELGFVTQEDIVEVLEFQLGFPRIDLNKYEINQSVATILPESIVRKYKLIPIDKKDGKLIVAMVDPLNFFAVDDIKLYTKMELESVLATGADINKVIDRFYSGASAKRVLEEFTDGAVYTENDFDDVEEAEVASAPIVRLINSLFEQATRSKASDIHIEPYAEEIRIRFRIDGDLREIMSLPRSNHSAIVTRIKIIGKMNIAEKRVPQDGRVETKINDREIDMRISTLPTVYGEKIVLRLLDKTSFNFNKEGLGLSQHNLGLFDTILRQPYGMILVTGPTGSGKSTTLASIIDEANRLRKDHIITIEDPIEFVHKSQSCIINHREVGIHTKSFAAALRGALREDPDIIMVGEMRDLETTALAVEAASTGHLVFATVHTTSAVKTVDRVIEVFPESEQLQIRSTLADGLRAVISQVIFKRADTRGRCVALEILIATPAVRNLIREQKTYQIPSMIQTGKKYGMQLLDDSIMDLFSRGWISAEDAYLKANDKMRFRPLLKYAPTDFTEA